MDILYHHRTQGTGAEGVHIAYIIKGFRDLGFDVHVVSPNGANPVKTAGSNPYTKKGGFKSNLLTALIRSLFMEMTWRNYVGQNDALALGLK
jgi:putative intracellular protease/amidase